MASKKIIISGGGTGGHIFPALAIAKEFKKQQPDCEILFVGAEGKMEMEKVPRAGFNIEALPIAGMQRKLSLKNLALPVKVIKSLSKAKTIIKNFKPDLAIGVGGYASAPTLYMASKMGVPTYVQEQNAYPGLTNKIVGAKSNAIFAAYDKVKDFFPNNTVHVFGNPIRHEVLREIDKSQAREQLNLEDKPTVMFVGGSLGARVINQCLIKDVDVLLERGFQVIWQCGKSYWAAHPELKEMSKKGLIVQEFLDDMALYYGAADLVVSRAGALAISELCALGKASIFIPSPYVAEDHQTKNAMALVEKGAALMVKEEDVSAKLMATVINTLSSETEIKRYENQILNLAKPNAAKDIVDYLLSDKA